MFSFLKANVESVCVFLFLSLKCCVWNLYLIWINLCCFFFLISGWMFATCTSQVKPEDRQASMGLFPFSQQKNKNFPETVWANSKRNKKNYQYFFFRWTRTFWVDLLMIAMQRYLIWPNEWMCVCAQLIQSWINFTCNTAEKT